VIRVLTARAVQSAPLAAATSRGRLPGSAPALVVVVAFIPDNDDDFLLRCAVTVTVGRRMFVKQ
jgi:hypothetical protein